MQASRQERKEEEEQVEVITYRLVEDLTSVGVNMSEVKKLQDAGFATIGSVLQQPMKELIAIKGFSEGRMIVLKSSHILFAAHANLLSKSIF